MTIRCTHCGMTDAYASQKGLRHCAPPFEVKPHFMAEDGLPVIHGREASIPNSVDVNYRRPKADDGSDLPLTWQIINEIWERHRREAEIEAAPWVAQIMEVETMRPIGSIIRNLDTSELGPIKIDNETLTTKLDAKIVRAALVAVAEECAEKGLHNGARHAYVLSTLNNNAILARLRRLLK